MHYRLDRRHPLQAPRFVFSGASGEQQCDYGVRVCTDYIKLPKSLPVFPNGGDDPPFGCRWVRKDAFILVLNELGAKKN